MKIILASALCSYRPKNDGSFNLSFSTYILSEEAKIQIMKMHNASGVLLFTDKDKVEQDDVDMIDNIDLELGNKKSQSERIRNVYYKIWEQDFKEHIDFKTYYINETNKIIEHLKSRLRD
jgi:hypothetical protein